MMNYKVDEVKLGKNNFFIRKKWLEKIEKNSQTNALYILFAKKEKVYLAYVSKNNWKPEK